MEEDMEKEWSFVLSDCRVHRCENILKQNVARIAKTVIDVGKGKTRRE